MQQKRKMATRALSYILFFSFHLYIICAHLSESSESVSTPLQFLDELKGVRVGDHREGVSKLKKHLDYLGYMINCPQKFINENTVDECLEQALMKYQEFYGLEITGVLDDATINKMRQPRCGLPDFHPTKKINTTAFHMNYAFIENFPMWRKNKLTVAFKNMLKYDIKQVKLALKEWEYFTHFRFGSSTFYSRADIRISFKPPMHNCIGDSATALAHALIDGRIHFNAGQDFSTFDIKTVALHELGHALGLGHSDHREAIMYPVIGPDEVKRLHMDDILGIRALYGK